jgi:hypothetical protein
MRSVKLRPAHQTRKLSHLAKHRSSVSGNFRRRCANFYAWLKTATRRTKKCGLRLSICSITLDFVSPTINDRKTLRSDSGQRELHHPRAADAVPVVARLARLQPRMRTGSTRNRASHWVCSWPPAWTFKWRSPSQLSIPPNQWQIGVLGDLNFPASATRQLSDVHRNPPCYVPGGPHHSICICLNLRGRRTASASLRHSAAISR